MEWDGPGLWSQSSWSPWLCHLFKLTLGKSPDVCGLILSLYNKQITQGGLEE